MPARLTGAAAAVALSALLILPAGQAGAQDAIEAAPPTDYMAQAEHLSQPIYPQSLVETTRLQAADGEQIYVQITRPDPELYGEGPWPVILEASPYHGTLHVRTGTRIFPDPRDAYGRQLGLRGYFAPRGYAVAMMDLRGTGRSTGCLDHLGANDASDLKLTIEWLAGQSWSNGRVGMTGHSYVGSTPSTAAAQSPEGLVTIVPSAGLASMYDHQFQKGVPYNLQWIGPMVAYEALGIDRDVPPGSGVLAADPVQGGTFGDNWTGAPNPDFGCGMANSSLTAGSGQVTGQYEAWHAARDWREGVSAADIPVFIVHGVNDNAARIPAAEWFFGDRPMHPGDKVWLGQWDHGSTNGRCGDPSNARVSHPNCRFDQWKYALHAWFDHHLQQRTWTDETGSVHEIDTGPPVEVFLNGRNTVNVAHVKDPQPLGGKVYTATGWAPGDSALTLYPDAGGDALRFEAPAEAGNKTLATAAGAVATQVNAGTVTFTSEPLAEDTLFLGVPQLELHASVSTGEIIHLVATLSRDDGSGTRETMNICAIQPQLRDGIETVSPVVPNEEMALPMQCFTMAHWVPAGNRVVLTVRTTGPHHATFGSDPNITIFTGPEATNYELPVVTAPVLYDDVQLRETVTPVTFPAGPAQPGVEGKVSVVPGLGTRTAPFAGGVEFDVLDGFDNASLTATATPLLAAGQQFAYWQFSDVDLYLQEHLGDDTWETIQAAENSGTTGETLEAGRQRPGHYRILVVNWAGIPVDVTVGISFRNQAGAAGPSSP
jgi:putative CocE/NonD family hydrolase